MVAQTSLWNKIMGRREIMAYLVLTVFSAGFLLNKVDATQYGTIVAAIVSFYFGQRTNGTAKKS